jgi:hypothetical protein
MLAIWPQKFFHQMKIEDLPVDFCRVATRQCSRSIPAAEAKERIGRSKTGSNWQRLC